MRSILLGVAAVCLLVSSPVQAEDVAKPAGAATAVDPRAEALVRRYLKAVDFERTLDTVIAAMLPVMAEQTARETPGLSDAQRQMVMDVVRTVMREKMTPQMLDRMVPLYAQTFSIVELESLVTFYESPLGRSITAKLPGLAPKSAEITRQLLPGLMADVMKEVFARICPGGTCPTEAPKARAS